MSKLAVADYVVFVCYFIIVAGYGFRGKSPGWVDWSFLEAVGFAKQNENGIFEIPFLDRMTIVFGLCVLGMWLISVNDRRRGIQAKGLAIDYKRFGVDKGFAVGSLLVCGILVTLYMMFW